jgi:hypothetical protein
LKPLDFALGLLARWDRRVASPRPLGLVLARPPAGTRPGRRPAILPAPGRSDTHVHLQPRIALTVVRSSTLTTALSTTLTEGVKHGAAEPRPLDLEQLVLRNTTARLAERVVERIVARGTRVEVVGREGVPAPATSLGRRSGSPLGAGPAGPAPFAGGPAHPAPLVVRRPTAFAASQGESGGLPGGGQPAGSPARIPVPVAAPSIDLVRLTDQVVTAIDARLTAQSERLGRA